MTESASKPQRKPILCLDFDGVLHSYTSGWQGADVIPDRSVPGAMEFLYHASYPFDIHIFSSRSGQPGGIEAMQQWIWECFGGLKINGAFAFEDEYGASYFVRETLKWPTEKPPAFLTIDDRAMMFTGTFPDPKSLLTFKPWNKERLPSPDEQSCEQSCKMTDEQFIERAGEILHNMALERKGFWRKLWRRWHIKEEPLRKDAARLMFESKSSRERHFPKGTFYVNFGNIRFIKEPRHIQEKQWLDTMSEGQ